MVECVFALAHIEGGANRAQAATYLKVSRKAVNDWAKRFDVNPLDVQSTIDGDVLF